MTRLNPQQHVEAAKLLLAHRHHRHGAPPGTPEPGEVSPLSCKGVSSLYCAYTQMSHNIYYGKLQGLFWTPGLFRAPTPHHRCAPDESWIGQFDHESVSTWLD